MMSFLLAAIAVFAVCRVVIAYATRPSRWTPRFAIPEIDEDSNEPSVLASTAVISMKSKDASEALATAEDLVAITSLRVAATDAISRGDVDAYVRCFARNAVTFTISGKSIVGSQDLASETARTLRDARVIEVGATPTDLRTLGETVFEDGRFSLQLRNGEADVVSKGRYAALWKRESGDWRIVFEAVRADGDQSVKA
jgi:ketosteroid isomerase-like protein